jgi:simple sugar transport system ATP-binding protein
VSATAGARQPRNTQSPVLEIRAVAKAYGAVQALKDASLELHAGEVVGLVGDNGAGKTTLVKCIAGILRPDAGEIYVDGELQEDLTPEDARRLGIEVVHQGLSLVDTLDVTQNFFLNRELVHPNALARRLGWMNRRQMYGQTRATLDSLGLTLDPHRLAAFLSGGQRQMVAVARALTWGRHIVIMDEPAAALGVRQAEQVLTFIRMLSSRGVAVVFISHNMQHVLQVTDRVVVLRHGGKVGDLVTAKVSAREIVTLITGSNLSLNGRDATG